MSGVLLVLAGAGLLWLGLLTVLAVLVGGRHPRRGGYIRPGASHRLSPTIINAQSDAATTGSFSLRCPPGGVSEAWETPRLRRDPSRLTGRGWSTLGTAAPGASGARLGDAA